jgi:hypothetical protein
VVAAEPPLPKVEITRRDRGEEALNPPKGYLVAHSDGFWHLFNEKNQLLSIPDDEVSSVRVIGGGSGRTVPGGGGSSAHSPVPIAHRRAGVEKLWLRTPTANKCLWPESIHHPAYLSIGVTSGTGPGLRGVSGGGDSGGIGVGLCTILDMNFREYLFHALR